MNLSETRKFVRTFALITCLQNHIMATSVLRICWVIEGSDILATWASVPLYGRALNISFLPVCKWIKGYVTPEHQTSMVIALFITPSRGALSYHNALEKFFVLHGCFLRSGWMNQKDSQFGFCTRRHRESDSTGSSEKKKLRHANRSKTGNRQYKRELSAACTNKFCASLSSSATFQLLINVCLAWIR